MMPVEAQDRLYNMIPQTWDVAINKIRNGSQETRTVSFDLSDGHIFWGYQDSIPAYPVVVLDFSTSGMLWEDGRTLDTLIKSELSQDGTQYTEYHGEPMYDDLTVTVAVDGACISDTGVRLSKDQVARQMIGDLYTQFLATDMNKQGDYEYQWPIRMESLSGPMHTTQTSMGETTELEPDVSRWTFSIRCYYTLTWEVVVDTAAKLGIDVQLDVDADGDVDTSRYLEVDIE